VTKPNLSLCYNIDTSDLKYKIRIQWIVILIKLTAATQDLIPYKSCILDTSHFENL